MKRKKSRAGVGVEGLQKVRAVSGLGVDREIFGGGMLVVTAEVCNFVFEMINPQLYSIDFAPVVWALLGGMLLCMLLIGAVMWPRLRRVSRRVSRNDGFVEERLGEIPDGEFPPVSVIVYSHANGHNLRTLLPQILNQDYPAEMEVIVVNDESADNTQTIVGELEMQYPNLYMTFAPEHSRSLSRRKLAITLGIKAARFDALLLTCGNCRIDSPLWMRAMMRHFIGGRKEVVIGYAEPWGDDEPDNDRRRRRRAFDTVWQSVRYLSSAMCRRAFMATGYNLAYTRNLFFQHKGFSRTLNLTYGDDDIFVNEITTRDNSAVELSHAARVRSLEHSPAALHDAYRQQRDFTSRYLPRRAYRMMGLTSLLWWLWPLLGAAAIWLALPSLIPAVAVVVLGVAFCLTYSAIWRRCSTALGSRHLFLTVPWLAWSRPLRTLRHRLRGRRYRKSHFTQVI